MYSNIVRNRLTYFSVVISGVTVHQLWSETWIRLLEYDPLKCNQGFVKI